MSGTNKDVLTALMLMGIAGFGWLQTDGLSNEAGMFPRMALGLLALLSGLYLVRTLFLARVANGSGAYEDGDDAEAAGETFFKSPLRFFISLTLIIGYIVVFPTVGYFTATLLFIPLFVIGIGGGRPVAAIATGLGFVVFSYVVFVLLLRRHLPDDLILSLFV